MSNVVIYFAELMSGSNTNMTVVKTVGSGINGADAAETPYSWICPEVKPYSAIYFYQVRSEKQILFHIKLHVLVHQCGEFIYGRLDDSIHCTLQFCVHYLPPLKHNRLHLLQAVRFPRLKPNSRMEI